MRTAGGAQRSDYAASTCKPKGWAVRAGLPLQFGTGEIGGVVALGQATSYSRIKKARGRCGAPVWNEEASIRLRLTVAESP